ncbi:MAG: Crp/Fnr family transcriptional regulator [Bacteroidia bacterium]
MNDTTSLIREAKLKTLNETTLPEEICMMDKLTEEERASINEFSSTVQYKKGDMLVREGQVSSDCYSILQGCVRQYYLIDGEEKTTFFYTEGQSIISSIGTISSGPSPFYLTCMEDTTVSMMAAEHENALYERHPRIERMCRISLEVELKKQQEMLTTYMISTPEARYLNLLSTRPDLVNRVPQYQLASYLGVKPESLSRIRKRIGAR